MAHFHKSNKIKYPPILMKTLLFLRHTYIRFYILWIDFVTYDNEHS